MGNLFDGILILIFILTVAICAHRGILKMLSSFRFLASFMLAMRYKTLPIVTDTIGKFINTEGFKATLKQRVDALWGQKISDAVNATGVTEVERFDGIFGPLDSILGDLKAYCQALFSEGASDIVGQVVDHATDAVIVFLNNVLGFLIVYVVVSLSLRIAFWILKLLFSRGVLKIIDRLFGGAAGILFAFIFTWVGSLIIVNVMPFLTDANVTGGFLGIVKWFYNKFILSVLFGLPPIA